MSDPDGPTALTNITWKWYRSASKTGAWTVIDGETAASYDASDHADNNDVGMYLRAEATYTDLRGSNKTADLASRYVVRPAKVEANSIPEFAPTAVTRDVMEGPAGMTVGAPVTATTPTGTC